MQDGAPISDQLSDSYFDAGLLRYNKLHIPHGVPPLGLANLESVCSQWRRSIPSEVTDSNSITQVVSSDYLHRIHWQLSLGEPNPGPIPAHGLGHFVYHLPDDIYLYSAFAEQRMVNCKIISGPARPKHNHSDDGCNLPGLFSLLCVHKYRGHEAFHLSRAQCTLPHSDGHCPQELTWD